MTELEFPVILDLSAYILVQVCSGKQKYLVQLINNVCSNSQKTVRSRQHDLDNSSFPNPQEKLNLICRTVERRC